MSTKEVLEGQTFVGSADGQFAVHVKNGVAIVIPLTGCFFGEIDPKADHEELIIKSNDNRW